MLYFYTSVFLRESMPVCHLSVSNIPVHLDLNIPSLYKLFLQTLFNNDCFVKYSDTSANEDNSFRNHIR